MSDRAESAEVVYRTIQKAPGLGNRYVGPLFDDEAEAKRALEHFIAEEHDAIPTEWHEDDGRQRMTPSATRSEFFVEEVSVRSSLEELFDDADADDGEEVAALAD